MAQQVVTHDTATGTQVTRPTGSNGQVLLSDGSKPYWGLGDLPDVAVTSAPTTLAPNVISNVSAVGTYTAPAVAGTLTVPPQKFAIINRTNQSVALVFPRSSDGTMIALSVLPGEVITFRQANLVGYNPESGNKGLAQLDARYRASLSPSATLTTASLNATVATFYPLDPTSAAIALALPSTPYDGAIIEVENLNTTNSNTVTVNRGGTDTIEGATSYVVTPGSWAVFRYRASDAVWLRRRYTPDAVAGTNARRDSNGRIKVSTANGDRTLGGPYDNGAYVDYVSGTGWPARPTGYSKIHWVGGSAMTPPPYVAGDLWTRA